MKEVVVLTAHGFSSSARVPAFAQRHRREARIDRVARVDLILRATIAQSAKPQKASSLQRSRNSTRYYGRRVEVDVLAFGDAAERAPGERLRELRVSEGLRGHDSANAVVHVQRSGITRRDQGTA
ncbi:MAG TPA: hypothetical protein VM076_19260 [Gemmatimonadaceae bacterium]|nr:hypothetical protein [Gemmatimonadaceae bacterium]